MKRIVKWEKTVGFTNLDSAAFQSSSGGSRGAVTFRQGMLSSAKDILGLGAQQTLETWDPGSMRLSDGN